VIFEKLGVKNMKQAQALTLNFPRLLKMTSSNVYAEKPADSELTRTDKGKKSKVASQIHGKRCPHCGNNDSVKNGKNRMGYQRWRCKKCYKYFQSGNRDQAAAE
jgi:ribosomal protein L37AE/L43A